MARQQVSCNPNLLKSLVVLLGFCLTAYILGPPLYWHLAEGFVALSRTSCAPCVCDCAYEPILSLPAGFSNATFTDCEKKDPDVSEEMEKNFVDLLSEELKLQEANALENQQRADIALLEAKKLASQYQKEADKCNSGMETCEEAREKAETTLVAQKKLTELWEQRARQKGWKDEMAKS
ncbi:hypothetical protein EJ110_NYTH34567 [Nymphaea thermarum]|nr:uncharacterized protein LOC116257841 [Nymphaea colorata]KAF3782366.1 hypothetical protein EJ110_NYTH34567 [Nymphaea thermarum]